MAGAVDGIHGFARKLASSDKKTRDKAIGLLIRWLSAQKEVGEDDTRKIWKALFYCMWHADKVPVQDDLAEKVASLLDSLNPQLSVQYLQVYLTTMRREWAGIDRLRLDKFCLLMRKCLNHAFAALDKVGWDSGRTKIYMDVLRERTLLATDAYAAHGVNLHIADMYLDELRKFLPISGETFLMLLEPFLCTLASCSYRPLLRRVREMVFDPLLDEGTKYAESRQATDGEDMQAGKKSFGSLVVSFPLATRLFEFASCPSTRQANRKTLYELHDGFSRLGAILQAQASKPSAELAESILESPTTRGSSRRREVPASGFVCSGDDVQMRDEPIIGRRISATEKQVASASKKSKRGSPSQRGSVAADRDVSADVDVSERGNVVAVLDVSERGDHGNGQLVADDSAAEVGGLRRGRKKGGQDRGSIKGSKRKARQGKDTAQKYSDSEDRCLTDGDATVSPSKSVKGECAQESSKLVCRSELSVAAYGTCADMVPGSGTIANGPGSELAEFPENGHVYVAQSVISDLEKTIALTPLREVSNGHVNGVGGKKKRKRDRRSSAGLSKDDFTGTTADGTGVEFGSERDTPLNPKKKVRFSLKNNLVWKPNSAPLPPQFMRTPPSATPRGSALKPGLSPGPLYFGKVAPEHRKRSPRVSPFLRRTRSVTRSLKAGKAGRGRSF